MTTASSRRRPRRPGHGVGRAGLVGLLCVMLTLPSCGLLSGGRNEAIDGAWELQGLGDAAGPYVSNPGLTVTMTLDAGEVTGSTGVNTFEGSYTWQGDGSFEFEELSVTERAGTAEEMVFEQRLLDAIDEVRSFEVANTWLRLGDGDGGDLLILLPVP